MLAVPDTHTLWIVGQSQPVGLLATLLPPEAWTVLSAGEGSQGPRRDAWAWLSLSGEPAREARGRGSGLLIRRSLSDPGKRAYYWVSGPTTTTLSEVAGRRWSIKEGLEEAKGEVGLDQYEVHGFRAWYRHITLALLAHAVLVVAREQGKTGSDEEGIELNVSELRRLLHMLRESEEQRAVQLPTASPVLPPFERLKAFVAS